MATATLLQTGFQSGALITLQNESDSEMIYWTYHDSHSGYPFEQLDMIYWRELFTRNWMLCFYASLIYCASIFGLKEYMKYRPAFDLKTPLILWNAGLGIFSILGFIRTAPLMLQFVTSFSGLFRSVCVRDYPEPQWTFWGVLFAASKYVELGDTIFIVLRKRPLQTIQWYHHIATLIVVWLTMPYKEPVGRWFIVLNYGVHSAMYPYFALKMAGVDIPKKISNLITTAQFVQMIAGFLLNAVSIAFLAMGYYCFRAPISVYAFLAVYGTFIVLFGNLFHNAVIKSGKSSKLAKKKLS